MSTGDDVVIVQQTIDVARYDTLREVVNQLAGLLVARQRAAPSAAEAETWRLEHRAVRARLDQIQPGTPEVSEALREYRERLAELRRTPT